jgi:hypothetical protein
MQDATDATASEDPSALPVPLSEVRVLDRPRQGVQAPAVQAAAVAATGFVAGAATVVVLRRRGRRAASGRGRGRRKRRTDLVQVVSSRSFLVDVHLIDRG